MSKAKPSVIELMRILGEVSDGWRASDGAEIVATLSRQLEEPA